MRRASLGWRIPGLLLVVALAVAGFRPGAVLAAPTADATSTTITIDTPPQDATGNLRLYMTGWAADPSNPRGTGVDRVEVWIDGPRGAGGQFLTVAEYGINRPDVGRALGDRFARSGYRVEADVPPGERAIYVYAHPADQPPGQGWAGPTVLSYLAVPGGPQPAQARVAPTAPPGPPATGPAFQSSAWSYGTGYPYFTGGAYNYPGFGLCVQFEQPTGRCIGYGGGNYTACLVGDPNSGRCLSYTSYPYGYGWPYFGFSLPYSSGSGAPYPYETGYPYGSLNIQPFAVGYQGIYPPAPGSTGPGWTGSPITVAPPAPGR